MNHKLFDIVVDAVYSVFQMGEYVIPRSAATRNLPVDRFLAGARNDNLLTQSKNAVIYISRA